MKTNGLKAISLIMAVLLWFYVVNQGDLNPRQNVVTTDLRYLNLEEGLSLVMPETVSVKLWGLFQETEEIIAYVDVNGLSKGVHKLPVQVEPVKGAMFTSVEPDEVEVVIKGEQAKQLAISHIITRNPPAGYELIDVLKSPSECLIRGEEGIVNQVKAVICEVDLENTTGIETIAASLRPVDASGKVIAGNLRVVPDKINLYVAVEQKTITQEILVKPAIVGTLPENYHLHEVIVLPEKVKVILPATLADAVEEFATNKIDITDKVTSFSLETELVLPEGVKAYPNKVLVEVIINKRIVTEEDSE